ncbi:CDGSH iron-sulfur domain-containing protein [Wenyingzhuangia sp. 2_MG-2023]|uniref:CDGSH iron-sulfur domain-containing protein n=1 Tax=Wenyingzhuangia sp. 2_MG-2023 TaxID=3062639 RepID=UPI0026E2115A|nr:CDGSH iron-sulfur domain-containing protein [Wenyingzhuangia sp. 2_MG-2023]MDO6736846.1 CDGSH iron-sulfur domain-containing protein [Wenyingzhuangia sp. 2_MG-2023]MDO6800868.1 CDGSH iron-sulfur domain-containing protein [Wenyingzhuangia sp. 1_MG-2023]
MTQKPIPTPKACHLTKDKTYAYCTCNKSEDRPFCDGNHKDTVRKPLLFKIPETEMIFLCTCGSTQNAPYCDGSH